MDSSKADTQRLNMASSFAHDQQQWQLQTAAAAVFSHPFLLRLPSKSTTKDLRGSTTPAEDRRFSVTLRSEINLIAA